MSELVQTIISPEQRESNRVYARMAIEKAIKTIKHNQRMRRYREHPELWLEERLKEDRKSLLWSEWGEGYENHIWDGNKDPMYELWKSVAEFHDVGMESATSTAKTYTAARIAVWFLDVFPNPYVITTAPKKDQLSDGLWSEISRIYDKIKAIRPNSQLGSLRLRKDVTHAKYFDSAQIIGQVAKINAGEKSATRFQGKHRAYMLHIIEEMPGISPAIYTAIDSTSTGDFNVILGIGNPDHQGDPLHLFCKKKHVRHIRVSGYDHPNIVLKRTVYEGAVTLRSLENRKDHYGESSNFFKSRCRGISPKQGTDSIVNWEWLEKISGKDFIPNACNKYNATGVDVSNSENGDKASVCFGEDNVLKSSYEFPCENANHLAYNLIYNSLELSKKGYKDYHIPTIYDYNIRGFAIGIDAVGVGSGTVNTFLDCNITPVSLQGGQLETAIPVDDEGKFLYEFNNRRSQMYWELREDIRNGNVKFDPRTIPPDVMQQIFEELAAHTYTVESGKIKLCPKDEVREKLGGRSPNRSDAIAYWNHVRKGWYYTKMYIPVSGGN